MIIVLSAEAENDLESHYTFLLDNSPISVDRQVESILETIRSLESMPLRGRAGPVPNTREIPVRGTAYFIVYRVSGDRVEIAHIRHRSQSWPQAPS